MAATADSHTVRVKYWVVVRVDGAAGELPASIEERLLSLRSLNFQFATNRGVAGEILALVGVRAHHGVIDIVQHYGEDDADAVRIPMSEPDILFPRTVLWRDTGSATSVIDGLLDLPDPECEPRRLGCWLPAEVGRQVWVAAADR